MNDDLRTPGTAVRRLAALLALTLALALALPSARATAEEPEAANKAFVREYVEECLDGADLACLDEYWTAEKAPKVRKNVQLRRSLFPDLSYTVEQLMAEDDRVIALLRVTGHHTGRLPSSHELKGKETIPPTGATLDLEEAVVYTLSDGEIRTGRVFSDRMTVAQALGYTISPPDAR